MNLSKSCCLFLIGIFLCSGCGYRLVGTGSILPAHIKTIRIPVLVNNTLKYGIETILTNDLMEEFSGRGNLEVIDDKDADSELIGVIKNYNITVLTYNALGDPQQFRVEIVVSIKYVDKLNDEILYQDENVRKTEVYDFTNSNLGEIGGSGGNSNSLTPDDREKYETDTVITRDDAERAAMKLISKDIAEYIATIIFVGF